MGGRGGKSIYRKPNYLLYLGTAGSCCLGEPELGSCSHPVQREVSVVSTTHGITPQQVRECNRNCHWTGSKDGIINTVKFQHKVDSSFVHG